MAISVSIWLEIKKKEKRKRRKKEKLGDSLPRSSSSVGTESSRDFFFSRPESGVGASTSPSLRFPEELHRI